MKPEIWVAQAGDAMRVFESEADARIWLFETFSVPERETAAVWNMMERGTHANA